MVPSKAPAQLSNELPPFSSRAHRDVLEEPELPLGLVPGCFLSPAPRNTPINIYKAENVGPDSKPTRVWLAKNPSSPRAPISSPFGAAVSRSLRHWRSLTFEQCLTLARFFHQLIHQFLFMCQALSWALRINQENRNM